VLQSVSLTVGPGEAVALLGRNGAGKTTTLKTIMAVVRARRGRITWNGDDVTGLPPYRIVQAGIGYVPEERRIFPNLTVYENLKMARLHADGGRHMDDYLARVLGLFPPLADRLSNKGKTLSGGEQQMLTIARTLMGDPAVLLLDEPSEGLAPLVVESLRQQLAQLKRNGLTIVLAEQNVRFVSGLGDRVYILEKGMVRYQGSMAEFLADEPVRQAYLAV
jgi:branched-chain amino acid transport system ATP-binding protein